MSLDPLATPLGLRKLLQRMVDQGLITVEQLDTPSKGYQACMDEMAAHKVFALRAFKPAKPYANPLRDHHQPPAVEITSPRDFAAPSARPGVPPGDPPLPLPRELDQPLDHSGDQPEDPGADEAHRELPF